MTEQRAASAVSDRLHRTAPRARRARLANEWLRLAVAAAPPWPFSSDPAPNRPSDERRETASLGPVPIAASRRRARRGRRRCSHAAKEELRETGDRRGEPRVAVWPEAASRRARGFRLRGGRRAHARNSSHSSLASRWRARRRDRGAARGRVRITRSAAPAWRRRRSRAETRRHALPSHPVAHAASRPRPRLQFVPEPARRIRARRRWSARARVCRLSRAGPRRAARRERRLRANAVGSRSRVQVAAGSRVLRASARRRRRSRARPLRAAQREAVPASHRARGLIGLAAGVAPANASRRISRGDSSPSSSRETRREGRRDRGAARPRPSRALCAPARRRR
jgi:hypothetical protein